MRHSHTTAPLAHLETAPEPAPVQPALEPARPAPEPALQTHACSRAKHLLRAFVIEPQLTGVFVLLLLGGASVFASFVCGGAN